MSPTPRRNHATTDGVRLRRARDGHGHLGDVGTGSQRRVQDLAAHDADEGDGRGHDHADPERWRRVRGQRLPVRGHPGWDLAEDPRQGSRRPLREPRDEQGAVPVRLRARHPAGPHGNQRGERLRQLPGQPDRPESELCRRAGRLLRDPEQRRLPAVLLELPGHQQGGVRPRHPVHERGVTGLRVPAGGIVAASPQQRGRRGERRRPRTRHQEQAVPRDLRDGPAQPRERRCDPRVRRPGGAFGRRHVHERPAHDPTGVPTPPAQLGPSQSQLYSYIAPDTDSLLDDEGELWAFVSDNTELRRLLRLRPRLRPRR